MSPRSLRLMAARALAFTRLGCYIDNTADRTFTDKFVADDLMTTEMCAAACQLYLYFGVEWGRECYCSMAAPTASVTHSNSNPIMISRGIWQGLNLLVLPL